MKLLHQDHPYQFWVDGRKFRVDYVPGESNASLFGGNSNWRGPIWFPLNDLLIEALERYHHYYGDHFTVKCPTGSGRLCTLQDVVDELSLRLAVIFRPDEHGQRPCHGERLDYRDVPDRRDLLLFHEYFNAETGHGLGASHQTGWTALVSRCLEEQAKKYQPGATGKGVS